MEDMTLEARLAQAQDQNIKMVRAIKDFARISLSYTYVYGYKSHGYDHAEDVVTTLEKLLKCYDQYRQTLSEEEICILLISCYLHDIGMIIRNDQKYEEVEQFHNKLGRNYIKEYGGAIGIDIRILNKVVDVCYAHSNFYDEKENMVNTLENRLPEHFSIVPANRKLAALLRVANMFALKINPLAHIPQTLFFQKDTEYKDEWLLRKKMTDVNFSGSGDVKLTVNWNQDPGTTLLDVYRVKLALCKLVADLGGRLEECRRYLPPEIDLRRIVSNLEEYHQSLDGQQHDMMSLIEGSIRKGTNWLLDQREDAWGTLKGSRLRVATTAKSIVALLDHSRPQDIHNSEKQLGDAFRWALEQHDAVKGGFPATTLQPYSTSIVHCTGMAIYAYALLCEVGFLVHDENSNEAKGIRQAINWLLQIKQPDGWGNWEGQPVRPLSSYWALRALKRISRFMTLDHPIDFAGELNAFSKLLDLQKSQRIESLATSCFFLILMDELEINLPEYPRLEFLAHESIDKLFRKRLPEDGLWFDEIEQFNIIENNQVALVSHWTHHITALAVHALSVNKKLLEERNDRMELLYESILALINNQRSDGNFDFIPPNMNNKITPSYEALNSLHKALDNLF